MKSRRIGVIISLFTPVFYPAFLPAAQQQFVFTVPAYQVLTELDGSQQISVPGYSNLGIPGHPALPMRIFCVALPPDVDIDSISVKSVGIAPTELGKFTIRELPPMATWDGNNRVIASYQSVYNRDGFFPENTVEYAGFSRMRKWRIAKIRFSPFQYNPVTKDLRIVSNASVQVSYNLSPVRLATDSQLADRVMDSRAKDRFLNYSTAAGWYQPKVVVPGPQLTNDYVIITTNAIESGHTSALSSFITYLMSKGRTPLIVTEDEYSGLTGQAPNGTAEKIRQWLINNYTTLGIKYVLLIGNPDPSAGDIPMKMCVPRNTALTHRESPTDYFYADLTGNWDLDADGHFGEYSGDSGAGGVDFGNEVYVGRIPIYPEYPYLDQVLAKIISYGMSTDTAWRRKFLLPLSFSDDKTDGAYLGEALVSQYLAPAGIGYERLYMQGSVCGEADSQYPGESELVGGATAALWSANSYGMVFWWGHGNETEAFLGYSGCGMASILNIYDMPSLENSHPSFVFQCSCSNAFPEEHSNLASQILIRGGISTVAASRVSWFNQGNWSTSLRYLADNASIGFWYAHELIENAKAAGDALYDVKNDMGTNMSGAWNDDAASWMNLFDFNLYGDPATALYADFVISGHIRDTDNEPIESVSMDYSEGTVLTDAEGYYRIAVAQRWAGTVTPSRAGYEFYPASRAYSALTSSMYDQDFSRTDTTAGVTTSAISDIMNSTAIGGGTVIADGGSPVTARGVCWSPDPFPTLEDPYTVDGSGTGSFVSNITSLSPGTLYHVRAYATNSIGTAYGEEVAFTSAALSLPINVNTPNGGETWLSGSSQAIIWTWTGTFPYVAIDYSIDGGQTWLSITSSTPNTGSYSWAVPATPSGSCLIRISDASNSAVSDVSDNVFLISSIPLGSAQWAKSFDGPSFDYPVEVRETADRGFLLVGDTASWGGNYDTWVIKLRKDGQKEWDKIYRTNDSKRVIALEQTSDHGFLILGTLLRQTESYTTFLSKISETGVPIWQKTLDVGEVLYPTSFFRTVDDGCVISGSGDPAVPSWIMKVSPTGNPLWLKKFDLDQVSSIVSINQTSDGGIVALGTSSTEPSGTLVAFKLSGNGEIDSESGWQHFIRPIEPSSSRSIEIVATSDGGYGILGTSASGTQLWASRLSPDGQMSWQKSYSGPGFFYQPESFQHTPDGGFIITGIDMSGGNKAFLVKLNNQGDFQWGKLAHFGCASEGISIVNSSDNGFAVAGVDFCPSFMSLLVLKLASNGQINNDCNYFQDATWIAQATTLTSEEATISIFNSPLPPTLDQDLTTLSTSNVQETNYCQGSILEPMIAEVEPDFGPVGTQVTVVGTSFGLATGLALFNGESATITSWSENSVVCTVPPLSLAGAVPLTLETANHRTSNSVSFFVTSGQGLTVTSPNGGETWLVGTSRAIIWSSTGPVQSVSIDYSIDGGLNWLPVTSSTPNSGSYTWTVPDTPSASCLVRIRDASLSQISDVSDAPFSIILDRAISLAKLGEWPGTGVSSIWLQGDYAYCGTGTFGSFGLDIINISDPSTPEHTAHAGTVGYAEGVCVRGSYAYLANGYSGLSIFDISNPAAPDLVGTYDTPGLAYDVFVVGNFAYLIDQDTSFTQTGMLFILDISNPVSPTLVGSSPAGNFPDEIFISGNHAYISLDLGGLLIFDITNPALPVQTSYFSMSWSDATGVFVSGRYAYLADAFYGLQILDVSNPAQPTQVGTYGVSYANCVFVSNQYAYIAAGPNGVFVVDVSDPATPSLAASYNTPGSALHVVVKGNIIFVADNTSLFILGLSDIAEDDLLGTWDGQGVYYLDSDAGGWYQMASPASMIASGDLDGDGTDDLIGIWPSQGGVWVKYSATDEWAYIASDAQYISTGDMNGDGRVDLLGNWIGQGVYYRDSMTGFWVLMASEATMIASGDLDGDGTDDLLGIWPSQGGVWVKYSMTGDWAYIASDAQYISSGDMNGDGREDLLGNWIGQGVYYRDSITGAWVLMASEATMIASGDLDGDGIDDLIGIWPSQGGVWVKYSTTGGWQLLSSTAQYIATGKMRPQGASAAPEAALGLPLPMGGTATGPDPAVKRTDESASGPGGWRFAWLQEKNLIPQEEPSARLTRVPGPGEAGFVAERQKGLVPAEQIDRTKQTKKDLKTGERKTT